MSPAPNYFGRIVPTSVIEDHVIATLREWLWPTYTAEVERQWNLDPGQLIAPNTWTTRSWFETIPGDEFFPLVTAISAGTTERPVKNGKRQYRAPWRVDVGIVASAPPRTPEHIGPRELASFYGAAVAAVLVQKGGDSEVVQDVDWLGIRPDDLPVEQERSLGIARVMFEMTVHDVVTAQDGPPEPLPDPGDAQVDPGPVPLVDSKSIKVQPKED